MAFIIEHFKPQTLCNEQMLLKCSFMVTVAAVNDKIVVFCFFPSLKCIKMLVIFSCTSNEKCWLFKVVACLRNALILMVVILGGNTAVRYVQKIIWWQVLVTKLRFNAIQWTHQTKKCVFSTRCNRSKSENETS